MYLGDGIVGEVRASTNPGLWVARVLDVTTFAEPLPFNDPNGDYWESGSMTPSNCTNGVRRPSDEVFARIVAAGMGATSDTGAIGAAGFHADAKHAKRMERYSVEVAMELLGTEFGEANVKEMAAGNPGFDIEVSTPGGALHVEK